ncbi:MAG TPA: ATP-binding protein, partial [Methylibium sp.]|nr:ATP-binding protein [Methylibium sp.]
RLHQILLNLLSNAVKYNREGGSLRCSAAQAGTEVTLEVADSGRGLDAEQQRRLFQPFERLGYETSGIEGTGLGLIIARRLAEEMGGRLSLASEPGVGTRVTLTLPGAPDIAPATAPGALPAVAGSAPAGDAPLPLRVLYVEDNPLNALLFSEAIGSRAGIDLRLAEDGTEALALVAHWQPDVLVIDARLPGLSGYEVLEHLRRRPGLAATPAFMCSADAMPADLQRAADAGFAGYWTKPIDIDRVMHDLATLRLPPLA